MAFRTTRLFLVSLFIIACGPSKISNTQSILKADPPEVDFGDVIPNATAEQIINLTVTNRSDVTVNGINMTGDSAAFELATLVSRVQAGTPAALKVRFHAGTATGSKAANLELVLSEGTSLSIPLRARVIGLCGLSACLGRCGTVPDDCGASVLCECDARTDPVDSGIADAGLSEEDAGVPDAGSACPPTGPCTCSFGTVLGYVLGLPAGSSCYASLAQVNTYERCTGGINYYASFDCVYTCTATGILARSNGAPCELGNGPCGGNAKSSLSTTDCPL